MDVRGFEVGLNSALHVEVEPGLVVLIPLAGAMVFMKALVWKDRGATTHGRDAIDLVELLERGEDLIGLDVSTKRTSKSWSGMGEIRDLLEQKSWVCGRSRGCPVV